jgi:hypothetical protein
LARLRDRINTATISSDAAFQRGQPRSRRRCSLHAMRVRAEDNQRRLSSICRIAHCTARCTAGERSSLTAFLK